MSNWRTVLGLVLIAAFWFGVGWYAHRSDCDWQEFHVRIGMDDALAQEFIGAVYADGAWTAGCPDGTWGTINITCDKRQPTPTPNCHEPTPIHKPMTTISGPDNREPVAYMPAQDDWIYTYDGKYWTYTNDQGWFHVVPPWPTPTPEVTP